MGMTYVSYAQLAKDVIAFSSSLPYYDCIAGVPRSGMPAASMLALHRNAMLTDTDSLTAGRFYLGGQRCPDAPAFKVLVLDDSVLAGKQIRLVKDKLRDVGIKIEYACMYMKPRSEEHVDHYYKLLPLPRIFEWNVFHGYWMQFACLDIDGVLCRDPSREENDDCVRYHRFLTTVNPRIVPSVQVHTLVTSRLEKYRQETVAWLAKHGISYKRLIMHPAPTAVARRQAGDHAKRKAHAYHPTHYKLFVESSQRQSLEINRLTKKPVLCTDTGKLYA